MKRRMILAAVVIGVAVWGGSFVSFAAMVGGLSPDRSASADGIVVLTGGALRVGAGVELLASDRGERLLISGVDGSVSRRTLAESLSAAESFACCVDIGRQAKDTAGNAREASEWVRRHGYDSVLVVTSAYHMPRALLEFTRAMPDTRLVPWPVVDPDVHLDRWWAWPGTLRLLTGEHAKYAAKYMLVGAAEITGQ